MPTDWLLFTSSEAASGSLSLTCRSTSTVPGTAPGLSTGCTRRVSLRLSVPSCCCSTLKLGTWPSATSVATARMRPCE